MTERASMAAQLPLHLGLRPRARLDGFVPGDNAQALHSLRTALTADGEALIVVWGPRGCGKTHLLAGACAEADARGLACGYLPLADPQLAPEVLEALADLDVLCLDDLQAIVGNRAWERGLFNLFNALRERGARLLCAADRAPAQLPLALADLRTRLTWGLIYRLHPLNDTGKQRVLEDNARQRGLSLRPEVATYLLRHCARDLPSLLTVLERLDRASLAEQRALTLPFVRAALQRDPEA